MRGTGGSFTRSQCIRSAWVQAVYLRKGLTPKHMTSRTVRMCIVLQLCHTFADSGDQRRLLSHQHSDFASNAVVMSGDYYKHSDLDNNVSYKEDEIRQKPLPSGGRGSCYTCQTMHSGDWCRNISSYKAYRNNNNDQLPEGITTPFETTCPVTSRFCQVRRIIYKIKNMTEFEDWGLERGCAHTCKPFCVTMGGRTKLTYCTSCCRWDPLPGNEDGNDNCNTDNMAVVQMSGKIIKIFINKTNSCGAFRYHHSVSLFAGMALCKINMKPVTKIEFLTCK